MLLSHLAVILSLKSTLSIFFPFHYEMHFAVNQLQVICGCLERADEVTAAQPLQQHTTHPGMTQMVCCCHRSAEGTRGSDLVSE